MQKLEKVVFLSFIRRKRRKRKNIDNSVNFPVIFHFERETIIIKNRIVAITSDYSLPIAINVQSLKEAINFFKKLSKLKLPSLSSLYLLMPIRVFISEFNKSLLFLIFQNFLHISTAYCNCFHNLI